MAAIDIRAVRKSFGRSEIIQGINLSIAPSEFVVVLGPSGCGKSTLLRMIAGLEAVTSGVIEIDGRIVNDLEPKARGCAMVFQTYALYPHMTVAENIGYALKVAGVAKAERRARVAKVAETLELGGLLERRPAQLSGGQRQRVAMGRAMIREPTIFLFDEPLSNLDARLRVQMRAEIRRLHQRLGTTSIFVTHDQVEAMTLADRLVVMNAGRVEQLGTPSEVYAEPATRFVASFLGSPPMNLIDGRIEQGRFIAGSGSVLALPPELAAGADGPATLGVRPEALRLGDGPAALPATVDFVEELGAGRIVQLDLAGIPLSASVSGNERYRSGDAVGVTWLAQDVHLFDGVSKARRKPAGKIAKSEVQRAAG
jgi:sn-glycerol 3-phosphate transport system ATP-binding protein